MDIVIIGLGSIARKHIAALKIISDDAKVYALRSGKRNEDVEGVVNITDLDELDKKPDFAIIANPTNLHGKYIRELAGRGIAVMIEKPVLHTLKEAADVLQTVREKKAFTYVACNLRFHPCISFLKQQLTDRINDINEVNVYCGSYLPDWRPDQDYKKIYSANARMGGGVHLDLIHEIDYTSWLFGKPLQYRAYTSSRSSLQIDAPDYANYLLQYDHFNASVTLNYYRRDPKRTLEIVFDDYTWMADLINNTIIQHPGIVIYEAGSFKMMDTYVQQLRYFTDHLNQQKSPMNSFEESLDVLNISLANE